MPRISIAMTVYNGEVFIAEQINSLLVQTFQDFEIVIGDDASSDRSAEVIRQFAAMDNRIRTILHPTNIGLRRNLEAVLAACSGDFIAPCDQDDIWEPEKLELLYNRMQQTSTALAYCNSALVDAEGKPMGRTLFDQRPPIQGGDPLAFAFTNTISGHAMLIRRELLSKCLPLPEGVLYDWWIGAVAAGYGHFSIERRPLVRFRQHQSSVTDLARTHKRDRSLANKSERMRKRERVLTDRLTVFARLPGKAGSDYRHLLTLWQARQKSRVTPRLAAYIWLHRERLFPGKKRSALGQIGLFFRFLVH